MQYNKHVVSTYRMIELPCGCGTSSHLGERKTYSDLYPGIFFCIVVVFVTLCKAALMLCSHSLQIISLSIVETLTHLSVPSSSAAMNVKITE